MPDSLLRQVALVSESSRISASDVAKVSAALQKQATRDIIQFWDIKATVDAFPKLEDVPLGYWPIIIMDDINTSGAAGVHEDKNGQPFALVTANDQIDVWSLTASHELIEMLIDPFGNRVIATDSPKQDQGRVEILVEPCDPSEAAEFAYSINGVRVSDFYTPRFFDPVAADGVRYSFTGAIREPRQVLRGGYLSWHDLASDAWWQEIWFEGDTPTFRSLGQLNAANGSLRSQVDKMTPRTGPAGKPESQDDGASRDRHRSCDGKPGRDAPPAHRRVDGPAGKAGKGSPVARSRAACSHDAIGEPAVRCRSAPSADVVGHLNACPDPRASGKARLCPAWRPSP